MVKIRYALGGSEVGETIGVLGLIFKPETDRMESVQRPRSGETGSTHAPENFYRSSEGLRPRKTEDKRFCLYRRRRPIKITFSAQQKKAPFITKQKRALKKLEDTSIFWTLTPS